MDTNSIATKSIGFLVDELITTNLKCFMAQEIVMSSENTEEIAKAAKDAQSLNARRNKLIRAIDKVSGQEHLSVTAKTYDSNSKS